MASAHFLAYATAAERRAVRSAGRPASGDATNRKVTIRPLLEPRPSGSDGVQTSARRVTCSASPLPRASSGSTSTRRCRRSTCISRTVRDTGGHARRRRMRRRAGDRSRAHAGRRRRSSPRRRRCCRGREAGRVAVGAHHGAAVGVGRKGDARLLAGTAEVSALRPHAGAVEAGEEAVGAAGEQGLVRRGRRDVRRRRPSGRRGARCRRGGPRRRRRSRWRCRRRRCPTRPAPADGSDIPVTYAASTTCWRRPKVEALIAASAVKPRRRPK